MNLSEIELTGFMAHDKTKVCLPERGVVLVTGPNGAGKSGIVEGASFGLWGKTLRGTSPWRKDTHGEVRVLTEKVLAARRVTKGGKASLAWAAMGAQAVEYPTLTKAQEALEGVVGSFDIWRRTHVFSSADASHFTLATDGERKRLLEAILGLERFDEALEACRADIRLEAPKCLNHEAGLLRAKDRAAAAAQRLQDAQAALASLPPLKAAPGPAQAATQVSVGLEERAARLRSLTVAAQADLARLQGAGSLQVQAAADARAEASQLEKGLARLKSSECPTCGQDIPEKLRQGYRDDIEGAQKRAQVAEQTFERAQREVEAQIADLSIELHDLNEQTNALAVERKTRDERARAARREMEEQEHLAGTHKAIGLQIKQCEEGIAEVTQAVEAVQVSLAAARKALDELQAVESVLGLKGVRAHVLGKALGGLERVANAWLSRIAGPDLRLKLCPYSEKKTGGISDSISLDVAGAGEGFGYKASSGGERRRIDVALLLALAEVAQAAHGLTPGTLFADECFDALDVDGAYRVAEVLREIARDRAVVVISHSDTLQQVLRPALHYYVDGGTVSVR